MAAARRHPARRAQWTPACRTARLPCYFATDGHYIPYHTCSSKTVLRSIYDDPQHPSHLLLPVIPNE